MQLHRCLDDFQMEIEKNIRAALQEEANDIQANEQLRGRVMNLFDVTTKKK